MVEPGSVFTCGRGLCQGRGLTRLLAGGSVANVVPGYGITFATLPPMGSPCRVGLTRVSVDGSVAGAAPEHGVALATLPPSRGLCRCGIYALRHRGVLTIWLVALATVGL